MTIDAALARAAGRWPERVALTFGRRTWTYRDFQVATGRQGADLVRCGVRAGDLVGLLMPNSPEWLFAFYAIARLGAVAVPINPAYTAAEIAGILAAVHLRALILDARLGAAVDVERVRAGATAVVIAGPNDGADDAAPHDLPEASGLAAAPAVIYFSSGSTGSPKGIVHSHDNLLAIARTMVVNGEIGGEDGLLVAMPLAFVFASVVECLTAITAGARIVLQERFDAGEALVRIASGEVSVIKGVPSIYRLLLAAAGEAPARGRLRLCVTGGEIVPVDLDREFERRFGCPLLDLYGLTEAPAIIAHTWGSDVRSRPLSCGRPMPGIELKIVDDDGREVGTEAPGELLARAPWMFLGYHANAEATRAVLRDGWFATGDIARRDPDGYVYVLERKKELIKRSGFNVLPGEVEAAIRSVPGVAEAAGIGVADAQHGQRVKAFVVRRGERPTGAEILAVCGQRLAKYKVPETLEFVDELPKGATGKVNKKALRERGA